MGLTNNDIKESTKTLIKDLSSLSFQKKSDDDDIDYDKFFNEIVKESDGKFKVMLNYYRKEWLPKLKSGTINYSDIEDEYRSNSILESYNAHIKREIPNTPTWAKFLDFLRDEENQYVENAIMNEQRVSEHIPQKILPKHICQIVSKKINRNPNRLMKKMEVRVPQLQITNQNVILVIKIMRIRVPQLQITN